eukprot:TRINITY_DN93218_c0_g1_i1.p1 TRINITY_DN93218_c0_g1~~TRINITY_DN93218_c0_g1_i1.p1  ORF type:complete len:556 (+),score=98.72 TRINITY_DN93218_c0_g1_i1:96-1763(+)
MVSGTEAPKEDARDDAPTGQVWSLSNPRHWKPWLEELSANFTTKLLWMLVVVQWILKGFVFTFNIAALPWILRSYEVPGPRMQLYSSVVMLPWALKPVIGLLSDLFPVWGYHKMPYMIASTMAALVSYFAVGIWPKEALQVHLVVLALHMGMMQISCLDLLTEAVYSTRIRSHPTLGPNLVTFVWTGITFGGFLATLVVGPILEYYGVRAVYALCIIPSTFVVPLAACNFHGEQQKSSAEVARHRECFAAQPELIFLGVVVAICSLVLAYAALSIDSIRINLMIAIGVLVAIVGSFLLLTRPIIGLMNAFSVLQGALALNIEGGAFYFFTDGPSQYPEGPHFSKMFYTTGMGIVASLFSIFGMMLYQSCLKECKYRPLFYAGNLFAVVIHCSTVLVFTRYNLVLGIPDQIFMVGTVLIQALVMQALWVPSMVMLSQMCPKNMEATLFALMAGCANIGSRIAEFFGAALLHHYGVTPSGDNNESHKFENLWLVALIAACAPLVTVFMIPFMVPDAKQTDKLLDDDASAVEGSPLHRYGFKKDGGSGEATPLKTADA